MVSINFPNSPANGDKYLGFTYNASQDFWDPPLTESISDFGDVNSLSPTNDSSLTFNEDSGSWNVGGKAVSTGQIFAYAGSTAPSGYLLCNGAVVAESAYPELFAVISTAFNNGSEAAGNFRLPSLSGRIPVDLNESDSDFNAMGKTGGTKTVTLDTTHLPSHTHTQLPHNHLQNSHDHSQVSHSHSFNQQFYPSGWEAGGYGTGFFGSFRGRIIVSGGTGYGTDGRTPGIQNTTATNQNTTAVNQNTGGGQPHNNLQQYVVVQYIIKT